MTHISVFDKVHSTINFHIRHRNFEIPKSNLTVRRLTKKLINLLLGQRARANPIFLVTKSEEIILSPCVMSNCTPSSSGFTRLKVVSQTHIFHLYALPQMQMISCYFAMTIANSATFSLCLRPILLHSRFL